MELFCVESVTGAVTACGAALESAMSCENVNPSPPTANAPAASVNAMRVYEALAGVSAPPAAFE